MSGAEMRDELAAILTALHGFTGTPAGGLRISAVVPVASGAGRVAAPPERTGVKLDARSTEQPRAKERDMRTFRVTMEGRAYEVTVEEIRASAPLSPAVPQSRHPQPTPPKAAARPAGERRILAPMPGKIVAVTVVPGDTVKSGGAVAVLDAMKMENDILASADGRIKTVGVKAGDLVNAGDVLVVIE